MKEIIKSYKFRLYPNENQKILLNKHFGCSRFVYNYFLNHRKEEYLKGNKVNYYDQSKILTSLKKEDEFSWLREVNSQALQHTLNTLEASYVRFFKGLAKFPRFKSKKEKNSFHVPQSIILENNLLSIPKFKEGIKVVIHREIKGSILNATISKTPTNKYFVSLTCRELYEPKPKTGKQVGIDLGIKDLLILSDGTRFKNNKHTKYYQASLSFHQKNLSRKKKGSNRYNKQRIKVAKIHEKITNSRKDNLHKITNYLVSNYDTICIEDLNVKGMIKNPKLSKSIQDASWGTLISLLKYKCEYNDKQLVTINRFYPSSKSCSSCNYIKQDLSLDIREWTCPKCNTLHDRDLNAAKNILTQGLLILSEGSSEYTRGV